MQVVFESRDILGKWKKILVALIPKKPNASAPGHFRPISLCTILYKVYARILVSCLKPIYSCLVSLKQGAFVDGRCIIENILLIQEFIYDM